jgi:hypothetical protein
VINRCRSLSPILPNLRSIRVKAHVTQEAWNAVLALPALKILHMTRTFYMAYGWLEFNELYKLEEFVCGTLFYEEAMCLGKAVRDSNLEKLHITVTRTAVPEQKDTLKDFFHGLTTVYEFGTPSSTYTEDNSGFPSSLVDLSIEKDDEW